MDAVGQVAATNVFRRVGTATLTYGLGSFIPPLVGFLLIPLYTRLLTPTDYGIIELCSNISMVFFLVTQMGMPGALQRYYYDVGETSLLKDYVSTAVWFMVSVGVVLIAVSWLALPGVVSRLLPGLSFFPFVFLALLSSLFNLVSEVQRRLFQVREHVRLTATLSAASGATSILVTLLFVAGFRWGALGSVAATTLVAFSFAATAVVLMRRELAGAFVFAHLRPFLSYGLPLVPHAIGGWLLDMANRMVLGGASIAEVGTYSLAMRFIMPIVILDGAFGSAYPPIYFSLRKSEDQDAARAQLGSLATTAILGFLCIYVTTATVMRVLILVLTPEAYHGAAQLVPVVGLGILASLAYRLVANELFFAKKTQYLFPLTLACGLTSVCGSLLLVPKLGALGAAWSYVAGMALFAVVATFVNRRLYRFPVPVARVAVAATLAAACVGVGIVMPGTGGPADLGAQILLAVLFPLLLVAFRVVPRDRVADLLARVRRILRGA